MVLCRRIELLSPHRKRDVLAIILAESVVLRFRKGERQSNLPGPATPGGSSSKPHHLLHTLLRDFHYSVDIKKASRSHGMLR